MTKTKKLLFALPLMLILVLSAFMLVACGDEDDRKAIYVGNLTELNEAIKNTDSDHVIKLENDIAMEKDGNTILPVLIYPSEKNYDVNIDLNGHNINTYIRVTSKYQGVETNNQLNLTIENSEDENGLVGFKNNEYYYSLVVLANNKCNINLEDVTFKAQYGGIYTNGSYNGETVITAEDCKFISTHTTTISDPKDGGVGAYLASKNFTYNFEDCYFEGYTAYHTKNGTHNLKDCTMNATGTTAFEPAYYGNGGSATGNALVIESSADYVVAGDENKRLIVNINGGSYTSISNYAIEECSTAPAGETEVCYAQITIKNNPVLNGEGSKTIYSENSLVD